MEKNRRSKSNRNFHQRSKSEKVDSIFNYNSSKVKTQVKPFIDDTDIKSTKSNEKTTSKPVITKMGFNISEASLDEKMNYLQSLFKNMNKKYAAALGFDKEDAIVSDKFMD